MLILLWFWYNFVALCQFCVRFGTVYVASAAEFAEMLKTQCVFDGFAENVGFVVGKQQFCGGGGDEFDGGEHLEDRHVDADVDADDDDKDEDVVDFEDSADNDHHDDGDHG